MERDQVKQFVKKWIEVIWEKHQAGQLEQFYHSDFEGYYNDEPQNLELLTKKVGVFQKHMKNIKIEILDLIIEGQSFVLHAVQKINPDAKSLSIPSILVAHLKGGKISKYWLKTEMPLDFNG